VLRLALAKAARGTGCGRIGRCSAPTRGGAGRRILASRSIGRTPPPCSRSCRAASTRAHRRRAGRRREEPGCRSAASVRRSTRPRPRPTGRRGAADKAAAMLTGARRAVRRVDRGSYSGDGCRCSRPASCCAAPHCALRRIGLETSQDTHERRDPHHVTHRDPRRLIENGIVQSLIERAAGAAGRQHLQGRVCRVLPGCRRRSSTSDWSARRSCTPPTSCRPARTAARTSPTAAGRREWCAGRQGPARQQGRAAHDELSIRRILVFMPAMRNVGCRRRSRTRRSGPLRTSCCASPRTRAARRDHRPHRRRRRRRARPARRSPVPAALWESVRDARHGRGSRAGHEDLPLVLRTLRDLVGQSVDRVRVDSRSTWERATAFAEKFTPDMAERIEYYPGDGPIFELYGVETSAEGARAQVELKSGGTSSSTRPRR